jgi:cell division protein FtsZ
MPRIEDFPPVAQRQIRAQKSPARGHEEERRPRGLLARLASGLSRRDEEENETYRGGERQQPEMDAEPRVVSARAPLPTPSSEFAKQPQPRRTAADASGATGKLDSRGRSTPYDPVRDEHLEIPAFLRRQSS